MTRLLLPRLASSASAGAFASLVSLASVLSLAACHHDDAGAAGGGMGGGGMKLPVDAVQLTEEPVRESSEYLAQLVSRHQVAIYPQVNGNVSAILVKPGQMVKSGTALLQIDPRKESANMSNQVAAKAQREASLELARRNESRSAALLKEGLVSKQQFEQDQSARVVAEASLNAQDAVIGAQSAELGYYRIVAPFDGKVGDIPVKLGDYATPQTKLTSVDDNDNLEAYVNIPSETLSRLSDASRVDILADDGSLIAEAPVSFVSEEANAQTQSILIKAKFPNDGKLRASQVIRSRVVWKTHPGVYLPIPAVTRQSGQYFTFVVQGTGDAAVAHQVPVTLGDIDDNRYAVISGVKPGDQVIVSQVQKLHDTAGVMVKVVQPDAGAAAAPNGSAAPASSGSTK